MPPSRLNLAPTCLRPPKCPRLIASRPHYLCWRVLHRNQSTAAAHKASEPLPPPPSASSAVPPPRRSLRPYIYAAAFLLLGTAGGRFIDVIINPPPLPAPGSDTDAALLGRLNKDIDALPLVQELRSARYGPDNPEGWLEEGPSPTLRAWHKDGKVGSLIGHSMSGWRGLGTQRTFFNPSRGELVKIMWFGSGLSGWPGVVHGGALATVCSDGLGELLGLESGERAGQFPEPTSLSLTYLAPTKAHGFYVFRAQRHPSSSSSSSLTSSPVSSKDPSISGSAPPVAGAAAASHLPSHKDLTKQQQPAGSGGWVLGSAPAVQVDGTLETLEGKVCVKATAAWSIGRIMEKP